MKDKIAEILIKSGCYVNSKKTNDNLIKTPNGDKVNAYLSCRLVISNAKAREEIEKGLTKLVEEKFDSNITIVGMATAGITWAHAIAKSLKLPMLYIRSSEKTYGLKGLIEGNLKYASRNAIIVDDVLYTGNTINRGIEILRDVGINTVGVACIATLGKKVAENLEDKNIEVANLTNYKNILKEALDNNIVDEKEYENLKKIYEGK